LVTRLLCGGWDFATNDKLLGAPQGVLLGHQTVLLGRTHLANGAGDALEESRSAVHEADGLEFHLAWPVLGVDRLSGGRNSESGES